MYFYLGTGSRKYSPVQKVLNYVCHQRTISREELEQASCAVTLVKLTAAPSLASLVSTLTQGRIQGGHGGQKTHLPESYWGSQKSGIKMP